MVFIVGTADTSLIVVNSVVVVVVVIVVVIAVVVISGLSLGDLRF